jgi:hypothetical protein
MSFVFFVIAARTASRSVMSTNVVEMPAHAAGRAIRGFGPLERGQLPAQVVNRRIEVPAIEIATGVMSFQALEHLGHRARLHYRECGTGLNRHVDATMFAEFMAQMRECLDGITPSHCPAPWLLRDECRRMVA